MFTSRVGCFSALKEISGVAGTAAGTRSSNGFEHHISGHSTADFAFRRMEDVSIFTSRVSFPLLMQPCFEFLLALVGSRREEGSYSEMEKNPEKRMGLSRTKTRARNIIRAECEEG